MKKTIVPLLLLFGYILTAHAQFPYQNPQLPAEQRAVDLCSRLTLDEKALIMCNESPAIPRLGIPQFNWWSEALHGIARNGYATVFPQAIGMAASWDNDLLFRVFDAVSDETRAKNNIARKSGEIKIYQCVSLWTPNINIFRDPRWGRGQETYGEDPYLTTQMGLAVVRGLQGPTDSRYHKTLACAKHFAVHSGPEWNRHQFNIESLPERDLWETYLPAFKSLVEDGNVREVMCAYQRLEGEPCCGNNRLLQQILRNEWKFNGIVTSDCGAISDFWMQGRHGVSANAHAASAKAVITGTDVECGSNYHSLPEAVKNGEISEDQINRSVVRLLKERFSVGDFDDESLVSWKKIGPEVIASKDHKKLALDMARESMTLLQNNNYILPLSKKTRIAVLGPNAVDSVILWGNYNGYPTSTVSILNGIKSKTANVTYIPGCSYTRNEAMESVFSRFITSKGQKGLLATYWNNVEMQGKPTTTTIIREPISLNNGGNTVFASGVNIENFSARYEGRFTPDQTEDLLISLACDDCGRVIINNDTIINNWRPRGQVKEFYKQYRFEKGKRYAIQVDYMQQKGMASLNFDIARKVTVTPSEIVRRTANADVVIFVGGISPRLEGEEMKVSEPGFKGGDRTTIELPQAQRDVIAALKQAGKRVVLVNCSGSAIALSPESQNCEAILQAWYAGEAGGQAVADVLFGDYNPSGKLPVTFYASDSDLPDFEDYKMQNRTYRYFRGEALFPFGHGLSFSHFAYSNLRYENGKVLVNVHNTSARDGEEVVELYIKKSNDSNGPIKSLCGFKRVSIKAGQEMTVEIDFPISRFETWDASTNSIRIVPGQYELMAGGSSSNHELIKTNLNIK